MRNLAILNVFQRTIPTARITTALVDVELDLIYAVSERINADGDVEVELFKVEKSSHDSEDVPVPWISFTTPSSDVVSSLDRQIVDVHLLNETRDLAILTRSGEIGTVSVSNGGSTELEVLGSIDVGIKCAAWSPDDTAVVVVTGNDKLLVMTNTFDVLLETSLHTADSGEDQHVDVGWGSKQTQFHGSLGKSAAQAPAVSLDSVGTSPDDDDLPRISWRGDGAFFVVSCVEIGRIRSRRVLRVYDRHGTLQTTSEPVAGLEHVLSWRPSGNLIASTQRFGFEGGGIGKPGRHDVVFFERNGLRHGEFNLREPWKEGKERQWGYIVRELAWSSDSNVLAVWIEGDESDIVQLWTIGNYHWYLKQEFLVPSSRNATRFTSLTWHPENPLKFYLTTSTSLLEYTLAWETYAAITPPPKDSGLVAVVDGVDILLTPYRTQNVPPPLSSCRLSLARESFSRTPLHIAFSSTTHLMAVLRHDGQIELWDMRPRLEIGRGKPVDPIRVWMGSVGHSMESLLPRQLGLWSLNATESICRIACLASDEAFDVVLYVDVDGPACTSGRISMPGQGGRLLQSNFDMYWQASDGQIYRIDLDAEATRPIARFSEFCFDAELISRSGDSEYFLGFANSGRLLVTSSGFRQCQQLATNCNSYTLASGFIVFTTNTHEAIFAPLNALEEKDIAYQQPQWERRRVERGSRIVTAVPSSMSLVLQMPRGNLETIYPRPLVLDVIRLDVDRGAYRKAFMACRKHRINFNVIVEHNQDAFFQNLPRFIEQIDDVDHLNLFLTNIGQSSEDGSTVSRLCDAIRVELETKDIKRYINSILTAYVVRRPPDHESALAILHRLQAQDAKLVEDAVRYIIFLVDANIMFDTALGMYDFSLVLLIAQHSQRDPREYLPFIRELRSLPKYYQRHKIDDHLKRYTSALQNLHLSGRDHFGDALAYTEKHQLYTEALKIWESEPVHYKQVLDLHGGWLFDRREFRQAALSFMEAEKPLKAMIAYERALLWRELFDVALQESMSQDDLQDMAYRVAEELALKKRYSEAGQVLVDYAKDIQQSVVTLVQGNLFSEARRQITLHGVPELVESVLHSASLDSRAQIAEDIEEMRTQLRKQAHRLRELRTRKMEEPDAFYGVEDENLHNVDVMTDVSMPATAFTRYTVAPSVMSRSSKRTSRSKRKMERKVGSGRKGTVDEEEYLLKSIAKLVARFDVVQGDIANLLPHLMRFTAVHRDEAQALQREIGEFKAELQQSMAEVWQKSSDSTPDAGESEPSNSVESWAARMEEKRRNRQEAVDRIEKPELSTIDWQIEFLNV